MDAAQRRFVRDRANNRCEYCGLQQEHFMLVPHVIDHVRAKQHGGTDEVQNLALACFRCNAHKGPNLAGIDTESDEMVALFNPREQTWAEHFVLRGARIVGLTAVGRASALVLNMNAPERIELREELLANGELG